jgi:hypothetical protein
MTMGTSGMGYPFDNVVVVINIATSLLSKERQMQTPQQPQDETEAPECPAVTQTLDLDASAEEVWDAVSTELGRERWIEPDPDRVLIVEDEQPPTRISWWWWSSDQPASHVELRVVTIPSGTRVIVTETAPGSFPLARMAASFAYVLA